MCSAKNNNKKNITPPPLLPGNVFLYELSVRADATNNIYVDGL